jgi:WD40 repeat protein
MAAASGITVVVFVASTLQQSHTFAGHIGLVRCLQWSDDDTALYTTGADGNVCSWDMVSGTRCDDTALGELNRAAACVAAIFTLSTRRAAVCFHLLLTDFTSSTPRGTTDMLALLSLCRHNAPRNRV